MCDEAAARRPALAELLAFGCQAADALAALHAQGRVHGGLRPQVLAWQSPSGPLVLHDQEGALATGSRAPAPALHDRQRLRHLAPEQSGRLDRTLDGRTDLYALGTVLYEQATGRPPAQGDDAWALIHWHLAGQAAAPSTLDPAVPAVLSAIVMKLLAKAPEDRYQSAAGLAHDLARCARAWARHGHIEPFTLGERDGTRSLSFGDALVAREREIALLQQAFDACRQGGRHLVRVEGYAGIGKTALIRQLVGPVLRAQGCFLSGKFDQLVRGVPFGALIQAFQGLVRQWLGESEDRLAAWRARVLDALGANAGVLTEVMPEIELVVGAQPRPQALGGVEAQNRFQRVLQRFVAALASRERPLVLFLDDLQWADAATLSLLEPLLSSPEIDGLLLIAASRDGDVAAAPRLAHTLAALQAARVPTATLRLQPLTAAELAQWIASLLGVDPARATPLALQVHAKTAGNPLFAMQFLRLLDGTGLLRFDVDAGAWCWDADAIARAPLADDVVELMSRHIERLPASTQALLTLAACIGNRFDAETLGTVAERAPDEVGRLLAPALDAGLIQAPAAARAGFAFLHDRVQQAAYARIPGERRSLVHLQVGRLLRARVEADAGEAGQFDVVHHLNRGRSLIDDDAERHALAGLNLSAGRRAKVSTAYEAALELFEAGAELLGQAASRPDPRLAFELGLEGAECRYLCGQLDESLAALAELERWAPTAIDRGRVLRLRAVQFENLTRYADAIATSRDALAVFGVRFPTDEAGKEQALQREIAAIDTLRAGRPIAALVDLPTLHDEATRMVMALLTDLWSSAYLIGDPTLARLISATLVRLSLQHGNVEESAYGYVTHAITVGALMHDLRAADDYGHLALAVNRRFDDRRRRAKVLQQFHAHVNFWCHPVASCVPYAREACAAGLDSGDFLYAGYAAGTEPWAALASTQDLAAFVRDYTPSVARIERLKSPGFADGVRLMLAWAHALQGRTRAPTSLSGEGFDEDDWIRRYGAVRFFASIHAVLRLQLAVLLGDEAQVAAAAAHSAALIDAVPGTIWPLLHEFWHALAMARAAAVDPSDDTRLASIRATQARFEARAASCETNHRPPALLLAAERARLEGRGVDALRLGQEAVESCAASVGLPLLALAHERLASTHAALGQATLARLHRDQAVELYRRWGAQAKVDAMGAGLPPPVRPASGEPADAEVTEVAGDAVVAEGLDLASVLKAAQALAAEVEADALVARLLRIAVENAGAERGALVLDQPDGPLVHAGESGSERLVVEPLDGSARVPAAVVHYVRRTGEAVVRGSGGPAAPGPDDPDPARSLAAVPVRHRARMLGVLVVEHHHAAGVFTPARLQMLQALATQAAIALDHARLVAGLRDEVAERGRAQQQLAAALAEVERLRDDLEAENSYLRRDLIANVSHDLRTPLVSLRGYLEVVVAKAESLSREQRAQYLGIALRQSERLATLIDELFELAKLDFKGLTLQREPFAFGELAADVVQKFQLTAESRGVRLVVEAPGRLPTVSGDIGLIERVLENLIGNALKHTGDGGRVTLRAHADGPQIVAEVLDSGRGIAAAELPHVFDRFYRGQSGGHAAGAGLGLAIARRIVELHGGRIAAASTPGVGTRLWFTLPAA